MRVRGTSGYTLSWMLGILDSLKPMHDRQVGGTAIVGSVR